MKVTRYSTVAENSIPAVMIVNWDQTGVRMVPVNDWTMTTRGSRQVSVTGRRPERHFFSAIGIHFHFEIGLQLMLYYYKKSTTAK